MHDHLASLHTSTLPNGRVPCLGASLQLPPTACSQPGPALAHPHAGRWLPGAPVSLCWLWNGICHFKQTRRAHRHVLESSSFPVLPPVFLDRGLFPLQRQREHSSLLVSKKSLAGLWTETISYLGKNLCHALNRASGVLQELAAHFPSECSPWEAQAPMPQHQQSH